MKIFFITNMCTHYSIRLFEILAQSYDVNFYFTGGHEHYWEKKNKLYLGNFKGEYLRGFLLVPGFKITFGLFALFWRQMDIVIKTIDDRFALPLIFLIAKIRHKPFILWTGLWHHPETLAHKITRSLTRALYRHSDALVVYGSHIKRYLVSLGVSEDKIFIAPHAVNNELFNKEVSMEEKQGLKSEIGLSRGKVVLYVGRLEECKGIEYLIEAAKEIKNNSFNLLFIGRGTMRDAVEQKCKEHKIQHAFLDYIPNEELYRYYAISDIFVLPSITTKDFKEPWGLVINEAMNQGCPIVATNAVGAAAGGLVKNGINGFIVPEKNAGALKEAIGKILKDEHLRWNMRKASREMIVLWTPERMAQGFSQAINFVAP